MQNTTSSNYQYPMPSLDNSLMRLQTRYNTNTNSASLPPTNPINNNNNNNNSNSNAINTPQNGVQTTATSVINLSNSSDVVIGPMTQYMGAVTIYQYMDATVDSTKLGHGPNISVRRDDSASCLICGYATPNWLLVILLLIITIGLSLAVFLVLQNKNINPTRAPRDILLGNNYEDPTMENLGDGHLLVKRNQWGSANITLTEKLNHPVPYVMITHVGFQTDPCDDYYKCSVSMRVIQDSAIAEKLIPDVPANFYVGGNGFIYTGRGWDLSNSYNNISLAIAFIGDFVRFVPTEKQFEGTRYLINYGIDQKYIMSNYKLVAHNQTKITNSPGANVYREIITWPHWNPCGKKGFEKCGVEYGAEKNWNLNL